MGRKFNGQNFRQQNIKRQKFSSLFANKTFSPGSYLPKNIFSIEILLQVFDLPVYPYQSLREDFDEIAPISRF